MLAPVVSAAEAAPVTLQDQGDGKGFQEASSQPLAHDGPSKSSVPFRVHVVSRPPASEAVSALNIGVSTEYRGQRGMA